MTTSNEWVEEQAKWITKQAKGLDWRQYGAVEALIRAFGQEAIERTRAEERAHATQALKLAHEMQDKAVAAEREQCAQILDDRAQALNKVRDPGMANHCRALAKAIREKSR